MSENISRYWCTGGETHRRFVGKQHFANEYLVRFDEHGTVSEKKVDAELGELSDLRDDVVMCEVCQNVVRQPRHPIPFIPEEGMMLLCSFSGLVEPEMTKIRPVVVLSRRLRFSGTCVVAAVSTKTPNNARTIAVELSTTKYPWLDKTSYVKCAMINSVRQARFFLLRDALTGRNLDSRDTALDAADLALVRAGVLRAIS